MQAIMMNRQNTTPPTLELEDFLDISCVGSASTATTDGRSPVSVFTAGTTPPQRSPVSIRDCGPRLLPRVRSRDQVMDAAPVAGRYGGHIRTHSMPNINAYPTQFGGCLPIMPVQGHNLAGYYDFSSAPMQVPTIHMPVQTQSLFAPVTSVKAHTRNTSTGSIDTTVINKYRYPTYRQSPTPQPQGLTCSADALSHLSPLSMLDRVSYGSQSRNPSPPAKSRLSVEVEASLDIGNQTCLRAYLSKPNPTPRTLQHISHDRVAVDSFWWDVRNVYEWSNFNIDTILAIDGFANLLDCPVDLSTLPEPGRVNLVPESRAQLTEMCASHHLFRLNAALTLAQGRNRHLVARALTSAPAFRSQPEFVSNYCSDSEKTIFGNGRGRVVGIVRGWDEWNSGMRHEDAVRKIEYLRGLAALHKQMRDHGCRYGFIMSEIEVVCIRAGGPTSGDGPPLFGYMELSAPVPISRHGAAEDGSMQLTVGLALWYLHMLARDTPLPGQLDWKVNVGGPAAGTRQNHLKRDSWMPKPAIHEKRKAKLARGWFLPDEPVSSMERGKSKRSRT